MRAPLPLVVTVYPGCTWGEVAPAVSMADRPLRVVGPSREPVRTGEGLMLIPDADYAAAGASAAVLVPGGSPDTVLDDPALHALLRGAAGPVAAICNGALVLAAAGLLVGRRCTHTARSEWAPLPEFAELLAEAERRFEGSVYVDEDVVEDGPCLTAKPWAAIALGHALARRLGVDAARAAHEARYLRGQRERGNPDLCWAVFLSTPPGVATTTEHVVAHVRWLRGLENRGLLERAGPFPDHAAGLVVLRVESREAAVALAEQDPFVASGVRTFELRRWFLSNVENDHLGRLA
ncbi:hypothetical protein LBMAG42_44760 [Deltaproteobacteria bacterium]|nr:hypothetical protein LBMAG42_44760 [Deltaproteobacteria bacterium]